jgi:hypothetical protein
MKPQTERAKSIARAAVYENMKFLVAAHVIVATTGKQLVPHNIVHKDKIEVCDCELALIYKWHKQEKRRLEQ